jgi:hypothetical protein
MSHLETDAYEAVQAALLNSECHPRAAVQEALKALIEFADGEDILRSSNREATLKDAISHGESHHKIQEYRKALEEGALEDLLEMVKTAWGERTKKGRLNQ